MNIIKSLKKRYFIILAFIFMITSLSSVSADEFPDFGLKNERNVHDSEIVTSGKSTKVVVNLNEKVTFTAYTKNVEKINWNFGDKTKIIKKNTINQASVVTHTFKKVGTYKVKVDLEGRVGNINYVSTEDYITVQVVKKPDLVLSKLSYARKGKDVVGFSITVKNKGAAASKACFVKMWYADTKFKKYTKSVKISSLKPGKDTSVVIKFEIPYKYRNEIKYVKVDSTNIVSESIKSNNLNRLNDLFTLK